MKAQSAWHWLAVAVWAAVLFALQGQLAAADVLGAWTPNFALVLVLALFGRVPRGHIVYVAIAAALARAATSIEPPVAILAAHMGLAALAHTLRGVFEISSALARCVLAGLNTLALAGWFELVHRARDLRAAPELADGGSFALSALFAPSLASGLTTALVALLAAPALASLPGVRQLWRKDPWRAAASPR